MADLFSVLEDLSAQLPGCKMASIVDLESGMQLASVAGELVAQAAGADAFQSEMYGRIEALVGVLGTDGGPQSVVLECDRTTFVSELIGQTGYFWHVATDSGTTLGFTQAIMRKYRSRIADGVIGLVGE
jgi:hypothetical protein